MPNVITVDGPNAVRVQEREKVIRYKLTLSGAYVQAVRLSNVGELIDLTKVVGAGGAPEQFWGPNGPLRGYVINGMGGFAAEIIPGADTLHWLLKVFGTTPGTELVAGAYPAGITADVDTLVEFTGRPFD
jgi:hypothetical protein